MIWFSYTIPRRDALMMILECSITDHSIKLPLSKIAEISQTQYFSNAFLMFKNALCRAQATNWKCVDTTCLLHQVQKDFRFHTFARRIWDAMPFDIRSNFERAFALREHFKALKTIDHKSSPFIFSIL